MLKEFEGNISEVCPPQTLPAHEELLKRIFDITFASVSLLLVGWVILIIWTIATLETKKNGFFYQERIGRHGKKFKVLKIRTMRNTNYNAADSNVTVKGDPRITKLGKLWRKTKLDELPQIINVLFGQMSFVGPRPMVPGFADNLKADDRIILSVRPGITGPASLKYNNEECLLANYEDPEQFHREIVYPDKVQINKNYVINYSLAKDIKYIWQTAKLLKTILFNKA